MRNEDKTLCIYHGNCADGFASAYIIWKKLGGDNVDFYPGVYQSAPPDTEKRNVIMVDFSYKRDIIIKMAKSAKKVIILDHHKTAEQELIDLPSNVSTVFDMERSGAMITWDYFHQKEDPPQLLLHIQDRDLWRFDLDGTREIQACLFSYRYDFDIWDNLFNKTEINEMIKDGKAIERKHFKDIIELVKVTTRNMLIGGHVVPIANLPYTMASDAGHILADTKSFAGCYWDTREGRVFSLRSKIGGVDVSEIAKMYGGGGHVNASGFRVGFDQAKSFEI